MPATDTKDFSKKFEEQQPTQINIAEVKSPLSLTEKLNDKNGFGEVFTNSIEHEASQKSIIAEEQRLNSIENASIEDKYFGLSAVFDGSGIGEVIDYFKYDKGIMQGKDENFLATFDKKKEDMIMENFGLSEHSRPYIQEAKNNEHLLDLATKEQLQQKSREQVMRTYSDTENTVANLVVGIGTDPSIVFTGGASMFVRGAAALARNGRLVSSFEKANRMATISRGAEVATTSEYGAIGMGVASDLNNMAKVEASLMVVDDMKQALAKVVMGSSISYGAVLGATTEDTSMVEGLLAYGLLSPLDYKIINGIKVLDRTPRAIGLGKNTVDDMHTEALRLESSTSKLTRNELPLPRSEKELLQLERNLKVNKTLSSLEKEELKQTISARLRMAKSEGFKEYAKIEKKITDEIKKLELKKELNGKKIFEKARKLRIVQQEIDDIHDLAKDIEMSIADVKKSLEVISKTGKGSENIGKDILTVYKSMHDSGYISKSAYKQLEYSYKKGKGKGFHKPEIKLTAKKDKITGETVAELKINNKVVKVLGASFLAGTGLSAYDGTDLAKDSGAIIGLGILVAALGIGVHGLLTNPAMRQAFKEGVKTATKGKALDDTRSLRNTIGELADKSRTSLSETVKPILDNTTGLVHNLANKLYYNPLDQTVQTIESTKRIFAFSKSQGLERELRGVFKEWLAKEDISAVKNIASMFSDMSLRAKFNKQVWEHMTMGLHAKDETVKAAASKVSEYYKQVLKDMKEAGVKDADKMIMVTDDLQYVPRIHNGLTFANKITGISSASKKALINRFAEMLVKTPAETRHKVAEAYIENMIKRDVTAAKTFSKDAREALTKELQAKGIGDTEIDEIISAVSGSYGRTKARLFMDYSKFGKLNIDINGQSVPMSIDDIFMTDISSVSNSLFNQAGGHVAFAANGFKSVDDALSIVKDANMLETHRTTMINDIFATIGTPAIDYSQTANVVAKNIGNMATGKMMVFSTISLMSEGYIYLANTLRHAGLFDGMKNIVNSVRGFGDDSFIASDIPFGKDGLGLGQSRYGGTFGQFRTFDEFSNQHSGIGHFTKYSEMWRDFTLHALPFSRTSDFIAKANLQDVLDRLYKHLTGEMEFASHELSAFPISNKMKSYLEKNLQLNKEGHVKFFDYTTAPFELRDEFKNLMDNMMMKRMNQTTMGTSGAFSRQSAFGVAISSMLKYPMSAYSNLGGFLGRGALQGDAFAMTQIALWFQAGIVQSMIRSEISGREYDENDLIVAGLMNIPQYGVIGTITGLGDSPTSDMAKRITDTIDIYSYVKGN